MLNRCKSAGKLALVAALVFSSSQAFASGNRDFHVTITNLTHSINFTPILVASHRRPVTIFGSGTPASDDLRILAESGNVAPMTITLEGNSDVVDVQNSAGALESSGGLLGPGKSVTVIVSAAHGAKFISVGSMMLPTNDGFIGLNSVEVSKRGSTTFFSPGYDAGSEINDELCAYIPGPPCGGAGLSPGDDPVTEGYVHVHRGIHGIADLNAAVYDWRNPVARITVTRVRGKKDD
jgi:hypothetical protein